MKEETWTMWLKDLERRVDRGLNLYFQPYGDITAGWYAILVRIHDPKNEYHTIVRSGATPILALAELQSYINSADTPAIINQL